jgi:hypothetical protein
MEQFPTAFSEVDVDFSDILYSRVAAATDKATKEESNSLK